VIKDVFSQRESYIDKSNVDVGDNSWMVVIVIKRPRKGKPVQMIRSTYNSVSFFVRITQNGVNE